MKSKMMNWLVAILVATLFYMLPAPNNNAQDKRADAPFTVSIITRTEDLAGKPTTTTNLNFSVAGFYGKRSDILTDDELKYLLWNPGAKYERPAEKVVKHEKDCVLFIHVCTQDRLKTPPHELTFEMFMSGIKKLQELRDPNRPTYIYVYYDKNK